MKTPRDRVADGGKKTLKALRRELYEGNKEYPIGWMVEVPRDRWPSMAGLAPFQVFRSRQFCAFLYEENQQVRITVNRSELDAAGGWKDGITWEQLQWVKSQVGYGTFWAVEVFPPDSEIVNVANMRHLWIVDQPAFGWRKDQSLP